MNEQRPRRYRPPHRRRQAPRPQPVRHTPAGEHIPVMAAEILEVLHPQAGEVAVDCTLGRAGHARQLLPRLLPGGQLLGLDLDAENLTAAAPLLADGGDAVHFQHGNFAGLPKYLGQRGWNGVDLLLADLGMSSMQIDDAQRGFSFMRDGPLDMRMDRSRGKTAAELLASTTVEELARALTELGDEPQAEAIAQAVVAAAQTGQVSSTTALARLVLQAAHAADPHGAPAAVNRWTNPPVARFFQTLRILVNRETANLEALLRCLPACVRPGGRVAILSFHSGEDRRVKQAFREGVRAGIYQAISAEPLRPTANECAANPRSRSAKLRWACRAAL